MKYLPYVPLAIALPLALFIANADEPSQQTVLIGWVAILIGVALALSGVKAIVRGRVLLRSRDAVREDNPGAFWFTVVVFRFGIAAIMAGAGVYYMLS